jgi:hypothetical protein
MMMDLDGLEKKIHSTPNDKNGQGEEIAITAGMIESALAMEKKQREEGQVLQKRAMWLEMRGEVIAVK